MLKYKVGDLIQAAVDGEVNVIAHCANCFNTMKSGIAPQIVKMFPEAGEVDKNTVKGDRRKLGNASAAYDEFHNVLVVNLYGQYYYGYTKGKTYVDYEALRDSFGVMRNFMSQAIRSPRIGLPKLGSGLAQGDWSIIEQIIKDELTAYNYDVTIYVLSEDEIPKEG
ncbi:macro domain protein [Shewanella sp. phage 1/40]|uniref:phosphatase n=1 Tax=Shewanella sp. phage 1/40 TaxID=1458860 RepID=UPI0004F5D423|nr:phosphatase [Shewanella sp. phage 1/40]AHK11480.1 macro domain protein [Shewanella sp. phage 1/40]